MRNGRSESVHVKVECERVRAFDKYDFTIYKQSSRPPSTRKFVNWVSCLNFSNGNYAFGAVVGSIYMSLADKQERTLA